MNTLATPLILSNYFVAGSWLAASDNVYENILIYLLFIVIILTLVVSIVLYRAVQTVLKITKPALLKPASQTGDGVQTKKVGFWKAAWKKFMGIHPMELEESLTIEDHEYDGIQELDNPIPIWFNFLFYITIFFAVGYLFVYHVFGWGMTQEQEYEQEMAIAQQMKEEYLASSANNVDENTVVVDLSPEVVSAGQVLFTQFCAVCHENDGGGNIGPNLADNYWIHGGNITDVFHTIKYGVIEKGMISWEETLSPTQIAEVSNYIVSLRGTTPANPKAPEGEEFQYTDGDSAAAADEGGEVEGENVSDDSAVENGADQ